MQDIFIWFVKNVICKRKWGRVTRGQGVGVGVGYYCEEVMSGEGEGVLASQGTISAFVFLGVIVFSIGYLRTRLVKGYLHQQGVVCVG